MKPSLLNRIAILEDTIGGRSVEELTAVRRQCEAALSVAEEDDTREGLLRTIAAIESGQYRVPPPLPLNWDERARVMTERMRAAFSDQPDAYDIPPETMDSLRRRYPRPETDEEGFV